VDRKLVSICFLDLIHDLLVRVRFVSLRPEPSDPPGKYVSAVLKALELGKKSSEIPYVWQGGVSSARVWEDFIRKVFSVDSLEAEKMTETLFYYPGPVSVAKSDFETLLFFLSKMEPLVSTAEMELVSDYSDALHEIPAAFKHPGFDRVYFYKVFYSPFVKKHPRFFSPAESKAIAKWAGSGSLMDRIKVSF